MIPLRLGKKPHKHHAKPVKVDGHQFDSTVEAMRYGTLAILQRAGQITELVVHPVYPITINKQRVCVVELDFSYRDEKGLPRVEDVKGQDTPMSKLKRKMVEAAYGFEVSIIKIKRRKRR
jgi:hypothetical protein